MLTRRKSPPYGKKIERVTQAALRDGRLKLGTLRHIDIFHDDWCAIFKGGECNCNPDVLLRPETPDD